MPDEQAPRRGVVEILILVLTGIVAFYIIAATIFVLIVEINDPTADTTAVVDSLTALITAILGALLGLIAGRVSANGKGGNHEGK